MSRRRCEVGWSAACTRPEELLPGRLHARPRALRTYLGRVGVYGTDDVVADA